MGVHKNQRHLQCTHTKQLTFNQQCGLSKERNTNEKQKQTNKQTRKCTA